MAEEFKACIHFSIHCQEPNRWKDWEAKCNKEFRCVCPAGKSDNLYCGAIASFLWLSWSDAALWLALSCLTVLSLFCLVFFFPPIRVFALGYSVLCLLSLILSLLYYKIYNYFLSETVSQKWNNMEIYLKLKQELRISARRL